MIAEDGSDRQFRLAMNAAGVVLWSWNVETDRFAMDERGYKLWDIPFAPFVVFEEMSAKIHPADRDRVRAAFSATRAIVGCYEMDFRNIAGNDVRWISTRGQGDDGDIEEQKKYGVFLDVTGRKQAEESNELLAGEMSHRVKNLLSIAMGLTRITSRSSDTAAEMAKELISGLSALGRAHDLVRPVAGGIENSALLGDLITILLAPYDDHAAFSRRIRVAVPRMCVGESGAVALAMVLHELSTNSVKYGCLSSLEGTLDISALVEDDQVVLTWIERGGPPVSPPTNPAGFGSGLMTRKMTAQLDGSVRHEWSREGVVVTLRMAKTRLEA